MSISGILLAAAVVGGCGCIIGFFLGFAAKQLYVEVDEKEEAVLAELPGNNCGGCGYPGCSGLAAAIAKGEAPVNQCPVGGAPVAERISAIMGVEAGSSDPQVAYVRCAGTTDRAKENYKYFGEMDCSMAASVPAGGAKACSYGCLGFGNCVKACNFDALHIVNGIAWVDKEKCVGCGACTRTCPRHLIELVPQKQKIFVTCQSLDKGKTQTQNCSVGCIGCKKCEKACKFDAIHVEGNLAKIDYSKCKNCGICVRECPRHIIYRIQQPKNVVKKEKVTA